MMERREKKKQTIQLEAEGWGLSRKILFVVFVIIVLFTVILSVVVGITSSRHLRRQSQAHLVNMARIFTDNLGALAKDSERAAELINKDQELRWRFRSLAELGPYYYLQKATVGEERMDSELGLFLAAQLNIVGELKSIMESYQMDSISVYLTSPFDQEASAFPVLAVRVDKNDIHIGRFDRVGVVDKDVYYSKQTESFRNLSPDAFKVDSIFSTPPEEFFQKTGFERDLQLPDLPKITQALEFEQVRSEIITGKYYPTIRTWSPVILQLANPETLEDEVGTVGWLMLERRLDQSFMKVMGDKLGVNVGVVKEDGFLIGDKGKTTRLQFQHQESNYLGLDEFMYNYSLLPLKLDNMGIVGKLQVVAYSPATNLEVMRGELYLKIFITVCVIILLSTVIVYLAVTHIIHRPLSYLKEGVEQLKQGRLDHRVEVETVDELGYLSRAFNEMSAELKEKSDDLINTLKNLRLAESYVKNIIDSMPSILIGVDVQGQITQWNMQASKVTGISAEQAQGCQLREIVPQMAIEVERIRHAIHVREPEMELRKPMNLEGEPRFTDVAIYPLVANGVAGAVIRVDDVTERVRLQEMMIQSEKMLSVGGLAAGMAHEINNPLAGILQNLQVVQNRFKTDMPKNKRTAAECGIDIAALDSYLQKRDIPSMLEAVRESGIRASKIVANMLSFSRKSDSKFGYYSLPELIDSTIELAGSSYDLKKKYDFRKIAIIREYEDGLPDIPCDKVKIQQVVLNILENGAQALGNLTQREQEPRFIIRIHQEQKMACLEIEDNGPGMEAEVIRRVFEPFFTTKDVGQGTGLGLSVSYFIITENHQGTMIVESTKDKGSKFIIKLPLEQDL